VAEWERVLYNQNTQCIRQGLVGREDVMVLDVPYRRELAQQPATGSSKSAPIDP
jgi:hypothetical protein